MAKSMRVLDFLSKISPSSDDIPVMIKDGPTMIGEARSLQWLYSHGSPGILEARLEQVDISREEIVLQVRIKAYNTRV